MPNAYAHYRLGEEVLNRLSTEIQTVIARERALFQAGLYGPDIFFFYCPLSKTAVGALGSSLHQLRGTTFFTRAGAALKAMPDPLAGAAYLYGYVGHFALDSCCHEYVEQMVEQAGVDHSAMETELDRALLLRDGLDPRRYHTTRHLLDLTDRETVVIAAVHDGVSQAQAREAVRSMARYSRLLLPTNPLKRTAQEAVLRLTGQYEPLQGLLLRKKPLAFAAETNAALLRRYREGTALAVELIENYGAFLSGQAALSPEFDRCFDIGAGKTNDEMRNT